MFALTVVTCSNDNNYSVLLLFSFNNKFQTFEYVLPFTLEERPHAIAMLYDGQSRSLRRSMEKCKLTGIKRCSESVLTWEGVLQSCCQVILLKS